MEELNKDLEKEINKEELSEEEMIDKLLVIIKKEKKYFRSGKRFKN